MAIMLRLIVQIKRMVLGGLLLFGLPLVAAETVSRVLHLVPHPPVPEVLGAFDPVLGWKLRENASAVTHAFGDPIEYRINSRGIRDDEHSFKKAPGVKRVVLVGDSNTFGFGIPFEHHYSRLLERDGLEVINLGVSGYGVDQQLLMLKNHGLKYEPDLVIAYVPHYADERHLHTVRWGKEKPKFILSGGRLKLQNSPVARPPYLKLREFDSWLRSKFDVYRAISIQFSRLAQSEPEDRVTPLNQLDAIGARIVEEMQRVSNAHGAEYLLVTRIEELDRLCKEKGINSYFITDPIETPEFRISPEWGHLNRRGNRLLASRISERIKLHFVTDPE